MATPGPQKAKILKNWIKMSDKNQIYVQLKVEPETEPGGFTFTRIYFTEKSAGIGRKALRACGLDIPPDEKKLRETLQWIGSDEDAMAGKSVMVNMEPNGDKLRCNIIIPGDAPATKDQIGKLALLVHSAKKAAGEEDVQPTGEDTI